MAEEDRLDGEDDYVRLTDEDLIQLSLLRSLEVDEIVEAGFLDSSSRFEDDLLEEIKYKSTELDVTIKTGPGYPATQLILEHDNYSLPRLVMDGLRIACRKTVADGTKRNNLEAWSQRDPDEIFDYDMTALVVMKTIHEHISKYRQQLKEARDATFSASNPVSDLPTRLQG
jgi:hypothetical protein